MNCSQAKELDLVDYLTYLNHHPTKKIREDYWYLSPLRIEKDASFKVDRENKIFYDHGDGIGGTIIEFGVQYHKCTISDFLKKLDEYVRLNRIPVSAEQQFAVVPLKTEKKKKIIVVSTSTIISPALLSYLEKRKISIALAEQFCCEVKYELYGRLYYAIGFKNDLGGYELRNPKFKSSCMPKGVTFIDRGFDSVEVFEGFFSFLSFLTIIGHWEELKTNFLILNSLSFFNKSRTLMESHRISNLHLDRDNKGMERTIEALQANPQKYRNANVAYIGFKDWNKYLLLQPYSNLYRIKTKPCKTVIGHDSLCSPPDNDCSSKFTNKIS